MLFVYFLEVVRL